jgi:hypothetical protein
VIRLLLAGAVAAVAVAVLLGRYLHFPLWVVVGGTVAVLAGMAAARAGLERTGQ